MNLATGPPPTGTPISNKYPLTQMPRIPPPPPHRGTPPQVNSIAERPKRSHPPMTASSTAHQPPRCSHKTRSAAPPTRLATAVEEGHGRTSFRAPRQPHPQTSGVPQPAGHPHPRMVHYGPPSSPAGQPLHRSGATSQSMPAKSPLPEPGTPPSRQTRAQSQGPRSKGTQAIPRERAETPAPAPDNPQGLTPKPSPDPTRGPTPSPGLRPQMGNSDRGCEKNVVLMRVAVVCVSKERWGRGSATIIPPPRTVNPQCLNAMKPLEPRYPVRRRSSHRPPTERSSQKCPSGQECGPTPKKTQEQTSQPSATQYATQGGHMTSTPSHPRDPRAQPTERPVPDSGTRPQPTTRQQGNKTSLPLQQRGHHQAAPIPKPAAPPKSKLKATG
ncbi:hypothetical protein CRENBAI_008227 [Crenichthys baileyi]|uniref:Uncharacterized protein n=1 Tax=Crenichthys baileyi TaxID=28760 RepID=A0AAV9R0X1_9TELE